MKTESQDWRVEERSDVALAKVFGPKHPDGGDYAPIFTTFQKEHARLVVNAVNAYQKLTAEDWVEIYYALEDKLNSPAVTGQDSEAVRWRRHLKNIIKTIGPDGKNMAGGAA